MTLPSLEKTISEDNYSIVLVSALASHILDDLETLVAQLEGHLVSSCQFWNWVINRNETVL